MVPQLRAPQTVLQLSRTTMPSGQSADFRSNLILVVAHFLHPCDGRTVDRLLDGDVRERGRRGCAVPVLLAGGKPDNVAGADHLDRSPVALDPAAAGSNDQGLTERMRVPGGSCARLERDQSAARPRRL